jgi:hypothetical protein
VPAAALAELWKARREIEFNSLGVFAAVANEFANGDIVSRPWGANLSNRPLLEVLQVGLVNIPYLMVRSSKAGVDEKPLTRAFAYLILCVLDVLPADAVCRLIEDSVFGDRGETMPENVRSFLLMPIADPLRSEMQDVCSADCARMYSLGRSALTRDKDEVDDYWLRLEPESIEQESDRRTIHLEHHHAPCHVGFPVDRDHGCPLFSIECNVGSVGDLLSIIKRVAAFRKAQSKDRREAAAREAAARAEAIARCQV